MTGGGAGGVSPRARCGPWRICGRCGGLSEFAGRDAVRTAGIGQRVDGLEQPPGVPAGGSVLLGFHWRRRRLGSARFGDGECGWQAAAVGGGDFLNAPGQALPQVKTVADLQSFGGTVGYALPVGEGAVAAGDLDSGMRAEPSAELFSVLPSQRVRGSRMVASTRRVP